MAKRVKFVRGFHPPTRQEALDATRDPWKEDSNNEKWFQPNEELFKPIPKPTSIDDWLAQYNEEGQDCQDFAEGNPWLSSDRRVKPGHCKKVQFDKDARRLTDRYPGGKIYLAQIVQQDDNDDEKNIMPDSDVLIRFARTYLNLPVENLGKLVLKSDGGGGLYVDVSHMIGNDDEDNAGGKRRKLVRNSLQGNRR